MTDQEMLQLKQNIGLLRQWLNERTSQELLTSEQLEVWILNNLGIDLD